MSKCCGGETIQEKVVNELIIALVAIIALAVVYERWKARLPVEGSADDSGIFVSADEAGPTQSGIFRLEALKRSLQNTSKKQSRGDESSHRSFVHHKVQQEDGEELPDPFDVELRDD